MSISSGTIALLLLLLTPVATFPSWPHSRTWGFAPSGLFGTVVIVVLVLVVAGLI